MRIFPNPNSQERHYESRSGPGRGQVEERPLAEKLKAAERKAREKAVTGARLLQRSADSPHRILVGQCGQARAGWTGTGAGYGFDIHPQVTICSVAVLAIFIVLTMMFKQQATQVTDQVLAWISTNFGWFFILGANVFIIAALAFAFSPLGSIRIGGTKALPEFTTLAWYAMLLSAGMGIGLMFWSVGEPMYHYMSPSPMFTGIAGDTPEAAQAAMAVTFFHWGLHPWAIYAVVGLGLAFFAYNRGLPLTIRSIFYPILGEKIYGFWGNLIDVMSVLATLMGLATSLGLGVSQVNAGLNYLFGLTISPVVQVVLIAVITGFATMSVVAGLDGGVKRLSEMNMGLAGIFMLFPAHRRTHGVYSEWVHPEPWVLF